MKKKLILIVAILLLIVTLGTLFVACKKDKGPSEEEKRRESIEEAVDSKAQASVLAKKVMGKIPEGYVFRYCTKRITEKEDGTFEVSGTVYISSSQNGSASASYSCTVDSEYDVSDWEMGSFYKN